MARGARGRIGDALAVVAVISFAGGGVLLFAGAATQSTMASGLSTLLLAGAFACGGLLAIIEGW